MATIKTRIRLRADTLDEWANWGDSQILANGEAAVEFDRRTNIVRMKVGYNSMLYSDLNYIGHEWDIYVNNTTLHIDKV